MINGNMVGGTAPIKTLKIVDADNNEFLGVVTGSEVIFTATDNDVRIGSVYASDGGISTGAKVIPAYHTSEGKKLILAGKSVKLTLSEYDLYDYTKFQCMICVFNTSVNNSVNVEKVAIDDNVYNVNSIDVVASITKNIDDKSIDLNIINTSTTPYVVRFFTCKEIE